MSKKSTTVVAVNRLDAALSRFGVRLPRMRLLQVLAAAFGYRTTHDLTADANDGLTPPAAHLVGRTVIDGIGAMLVLQDDEGNVFAVDEHRFDMQEGQAANWLLSPLGGLVDVSILRAGRDPLRPTLAANALSPAEYREGCDHLSLAARGHLAIRSDLNRTIYHVVHDFRMGNMTNADGIGFYPLVDLMSNPAPSTIETGEMQMVDLVDQIEEAVRRRLGMEEPEVASS